MQREIDESVAQIHKGMCPDIPGEIKYTKLPVGGMSDSKVIAKLDIYKKMEPVAWQLGRVSGKNLFNRDDLSWRRDSYRVDDRSLS